MRIVFKPLGFILLILAMGLITGVVIYQQNQLKEAREHLAQTQAPPAAVDKDALPEGVYKIKVSASGLYLGIKNDSPTPQTEAHINQGPWKDTSSQKWRFYHTTDGRFNIQNTLYGFWLDDTNASTLAGDQIRQWYESNRATNDAQKWELLPQKDGSYQIRCGASGKALEIHGDAKKTGALVYQEMPEDKDTQKFILERIGK